MSQPISRRIFLNALAFSAANPLSIVQRSPLVGTMPSLKNHPLILKKIRSIDEHFVSIDGWVIPKNRLIRGDL